MISKGVQSHDERECEDAVGGLENTQEQQYGKRVVVFSGEQPFNSQALSAPNNSLGQYPQQQYGLQEPQLSQQQQQSIKVKIPGLKLNFSDSSNNAEFYNKFKQTPSNTKSILKAESARGNFKQSELLPPPIRTSFKELAKFEPLVELGLKISSRQTPSTDTQSPSFSFQGSLRPQSQQIQSYQPLSQRQSYTIISNDNLKEPFLFQRKSEDIFMRNQPDIPSAREIKDIKFVKIQEKSQLQKQQTHKIVESSRVAQIPSQRATKIIPAGTIVPPGQGRNAPSSPAHNKKNKQFIPLDQMPPGVEYENKLDEERMLKNKSFKNFNINFLGKQLTLNNKTCLMGLLKEGELKYDPSVYEKYKIYIKENNLHNLVSGDAKQKQQAGNFRTQSAQQQLESPRQYYQGQQEYFRVEGGERSSRQSSRSVLPFAEEQSSRWKYNINIENKHIDEYKSISNLKKREFFRFQQRVTTVNQLGGEDNLQQRQQQNTEDGENGSKFRKVTEGNEYGNIKEDESAGEGNQESSSALASKQRGYATYAYQFSNLKYKNKKNNRHTAWFEGTITLIEATLREKLQHDFIFKCYLQQADISISKFISRFSLFLLHSFSTFTPQLQSQNNNYIQIRSSNNIPDTDPNPNTIKSNNSKASLVRSSSSQLSGQFSRRRSSAVSNSVNIFSDMQLAPRFQELLRLETLKVLNVSFPQFSATFSKLLKSAFTVSFKDRGIITELGGPISTRRLLCQAFEHIQTYYYAIQKSSSVSAVDFILDLIAQDQVNLNSVANGNKKNYRIQSSQIPISNSNQYDSNSNDNLDSMNSSLWSAEEFLMFKLSVKCVCERQQITPRSVISFLRKIESLRQVLCGGAADQQLPMLSFAAKREAANRFIETSEITRFYISDEMNTPSNAYLFIDCLLDFVNSIVQMQNTTANLNNNAGNTLNQNNNNNNSNNSSNAFSKILNKNNNNSNNGSSILISTPTAGAATPASASSSPSSSFGIIELFTMLQSKFDLQGINNGLIESIIEFSKENIFTFKEKNQFAFIEFQRSLEELQFNYDSSLSPVLSKTSYDLRSKLRNGLFNYLRKTKEENNFRSLANEEIVLNDEDKEQMFSISRSGWKQDGKIGLHQRKNVPPIRIEHLKYSASEVTTPIGVTNAAGGNIHSNKGLFTSPSSLQHSPIKISKSEHIMLNHKLLNERDNACSSLQMEHTCSSIHESLMLIKYLFDFTISQRNIYSAMDIEVIIEKSMMNQVTFEKQLKLVGRYLTKQLDLSPQEAAAQISYFRKYSLLYD